MNKLAEIVSDISESPREAKPITDIPLGPRAPAPAKDVVIVSQPQAKARKHKRPVPEAIEAIPKAEIEVASAPSGPRTQEDYNRAAQEANVAQRKERRRRIGREPIVEIAKVEIAQALVGNLKRKDR